MSDKMSDDVPLSLAEAEARRDAARSSLTDTFGRVQARLNPKSLAQNAVERVTGNVVGKTVETVRARPGLIAAALSAVVLFAARKPIARLVKRGSKDATAAAPASLKTRRARRGTKGSKS